MLFLKMFKKLLLTLIASTFMLAMPAKAQSKLPKLPMDIQQPAIIYTYDALCGWCYGFSPVMANFYEAQKDKYHFYVLSGGMVTGERIGPIGTVAPYIKKAYKDVENGTGIVFGEGFLKNILDKGTAVFSSLKPGYALTALKKEKPEMAMAFSKRLQKAVYSDGILVDEWESYKPLATEFGLDPEKFVKAMQTPEIQAETEKEFAICSQLGVTGFPTVFLIKDNKMHRIAEGYVPKGIMEGALQKIK